MEETTPSVGQQLQPFNAEQTLQALQTFEVLKTAHEIARRDCSEKIEEQLSPERKRIVELEQRVQNLEQTLARANEEAHRDRQELRKLLVSMIDRRFETTRQELDQKCEQTASDLQQKLEQKHEKFAEDQKPYNELVLSNFMRTLGNGYIGHHNFRKYHDPRAILQEWGCAVCNAKKMGCAIE